MRYFRIDMEPVAKGRPKFTRQGFAYTPPKTREAELRYKKHLRRSKSCPVEPLTGPLVVSLTFVMQRPKSAKKRPMPSCRPDLDNLIKMVLDAANGMVWKDDGQIVALNCEKRYATPEGPEKSAYLKMLLGEEDRRNQGFIEMMIQEL